MPGVPASRRSAYLRRKKMYDWELLSVIAYPIFVLRLALSLRVVENRYIKQWRAPVPYKELAFPDLISYLASVRGIAVVQNRNNGQYEVTAEYFHLKLYKSLGFDFLILVIRNLPEIIVSINESQEISDSLLIYIRVEGDEYLSD